MRKILIVDPENATREVIKSDPRLSSNTVFSASHGGEALEILENHVIDCVIVDLNTIHVNGFEIIDLLQRRIPRPWIIATCYQNNPDGDCPLLELAISVGADEVLAKPYSPDQLLDKFPASIPKEFKEAV